MKNLIFKLPATSILFLVSVVSIAQIRAMNGKEIPSSTMDDFLKKEMQTAEIPGLSIAFINEGCIVYQRAMGLADIKLNIPANNKTIYEAASLSKSVFAFFVLKMAEKGVICLDMPLYKYLPYSDIAYDSRYKLITARMALSHTTGFPNWREIPPDTAFHIPKGALYLNFKPGTKFSYSGEGYAYLAKVLAYLLHTDDMALADSIYKEVCVPMGMENSRFGWNAYIQEHKATGYINKGDGKNIPAATKQFTAVDAAGGFHTNASDFANFLIGVLKGKGLEEQYLQEMLSQQSYPPEPSEERDAWGLGVAIKHTSYGIRAKASQE